MRILATLVTVVTSTRGRGQITNVVKFLTAHGNAATTMTARMGSRRAGGGDVKARRPPTTTITTKTATTTTTTTPLHSARQFILEYTNWYIKARMSAQAKPPSYTYTLPRQLGSSPHKSREKTVRTSWLYMKVIQTISYFFSIFFFLTTLTAPNSLPKSAIQPHMPTLSAA